MQGTLGGGPRLFLLGGLGGTGDLVAHPLGGDLT